MRVRFCHPNIVPLMGFCEEPPALVLPLMKRFSLHRNLHRWKVTEPLTWKQRICISRDAASGLAYLHAATPPVIHYDINSSNILLDVNFVAKISDFGFSIELPEIVGGKTMITATPGHGLPGTLGYMPPEYQHGKYSTYSDVFSYGVVVVEVFTGLMPYSKERDECCLSDHCEETLGEQEAFRDMRDRKAGVCDTTVSEQFQMIAKCCIPRSYKNDHQWLLFCKCGKTVEKQPTSIQPATSLS